MLENIMAPLDGSALAERALLPAESLARAMGATLHLVRVVEPLLATATATWSVAPVYVPADLYAEVIKTEEEAAASYLSAVRERLAAAGIQVRAERLEGNISATLLDYERAAAIDLVVMCSHGRSGLARFALGSVADRLVRHGAAPLLLARAFGEPVNLQRAIVPLDGSDRAEAALVLLQRFQPELMSDVTLLRVIDSAEEGPEAERYLAEVAARVRQGGIVCHTQVEQGDPAQTIIAAAGNAGLVALATRGRSGLTRWALGSVADRVARGGTAAVLLARA